MDSNPSERLGIVVTLQKGGKGKIPSIEADLEQGARFGKKSEKGIGVSFFGFDDYRLDQFRRNKARRIARIVRYLQPTLTGNQAGGLATRKSDDLLLTEIPRPVPAAPAIRQLARVPIDLGLTGPFMRAMSPIMSIRRKNRVCRCPSSLV